LSLHNIVGCRKKNVGVHEENCLKEKPYAYINLGCQFQVPNNKWPLFFAPTICIRYLKFTIFPLYPFEFIRLVQSIIHHFWLLELFLWCELAKWKQRVLYAPVRESVYLFWRFHFLCRVWKYIRNYSEIIYLTSVWNLLWDLFLEKKHLWWYLLLRNGFWIPFEIRWIQQDVIQHLVRENMES